MPRLTLTGVSCLQMVDRMDQGAIPAQVVAQSYEALWKLVSKALYRTHVEGKLKVCPFSPLEQRQARLCRADAPKCHCAAFLTPLSGACNAQARPAAERHVTWPTSC